MDVTVQNVYVLIHKHNLYIVTLIFVHSYYVKTENRIFKRDRGWDWEYRQNLEKYYVLLFWFWKRYEYNIQIVLVRIPYVLCIISNLIQDQNNI